MALDKLTKLTSQSGIKTTLDYSMSDLTVDTITIRSGGGIGGGRINTGLVTVTTLTPATVVYVGTGQTLTESDNLTWDNTNVRLKNLGITSTKDLNVTGVSTYAGTAKFDGTIDANDAIVLSEDNAIHFRGVSTDDNDAILRASTGGGQLLINSRNDTILNIDSNGDSTDAHFAIGHGAATGSSTELFRVQENGDVSITSQSAGAVGSTLKLFHDSASPADNDIVGALSFRGDDDAGNETEYANILTKVTDVSNGVEQSHLSFSTRGLNAWNEIFRLINRSSASAPSYTTDDHNGIILDVYNTGNPYPRYMNFIAKSAGDTDSNISFWTEKVGGSPTEKVRITAGGQLHVGNATNNAIENALFKAVADDGEADDTYVGMFINKEATAGRSYGVTIQAGSNSTDHGFRVKNKADDTTQFLVRGDGKIGINEASPDTLLHITGGLPHIRLENSGTSASAGDIFGQIDFKHNDSDDAGVTAAIKCIAEDNAGNSYLTFNNGDGGDADERLRITSGGQVNIGGDYAQTSAKLFVTGGSGSDGNITLLQLKHANTVSSSGSGDGPAILLNGEYQNNPWPFAKVCSVNSGSGYGADFQVHVHPANGTQGASVVKALSILGDGGSGANVTITDGNLNVASGHGIHFHNYGTGTNITSNLMDDYEEGTWTPTLYAWTHSPLPTYDTQTGNYIKIGNQVIANFVIDYDDEGTNSGSYVFIGGLPFAHAGTCAGTGVIWGWAMENSNIGWLAADISSTTTVAWLSYHDGSNNNTGYLPASMLYDNSQVKGTLIYRAA